MYYGEIKDCDIANGVGVRVTLFVSGCTNACPGCFQPQTWDFEYGKKFTEETMQEILKLLNKSYIRGLTLLGGEPMEPKNQEQICEIVKRVKREYPNKDIWLFTGFTFEELRAKGSYSNTKETEEILANIDVLVDGRFVEEKKDLTLRFRGSSNQRLIDVPLTLECNKISLWK